METGWIQVFVLVLSECVAPAGKTVCQEQELRIDFFDQNDCEMVLEQLLDHKDSAENIIVNREKSSCLLTARKKQLFNTLDDANAALSGSEGWGEPPVNDDTLDFTQKAHNERLANVSECSEVGGVAPCKIGEIIIEGATETQADVWQQSE